MVSVEGNGYGHSHGEVGDLPLNATIDCLLKWKRMAMTMEKFEICTVASLTACFQWKAMAMAIAMEELEICHSMPPSIVF